MMFLKYMRPLSSHSITKCEKYKLFLITYQIAIIVGIFRVSECSVLKSQKFLIKSYKKPRVFQVQDTKPHPNSQQNIPLIRHPSHNPPALNKLIPHRSRRAITAVPVPIHTTSKTTIQLLTPLIKAKLSLRMEGRYLIILSQCTSRSSARSPHQRNSIRRGDYITLLPSSIFSPLVN